MESHGPWRGHSAHEPTTTKRKKPSMMGPTGILSPFFCGTHSHTTRRVQTNRRQGEQAEADTGDTPTTPAHTQRRTFAPRWPHQRRGRACLRCPSSSCRWSGGASEQLTQTPVAQKGRGRMPEEAGMSARCTGVRPHPCVYILMGVRSGDESASVVQHGTIAQYVSHHLF
eukprot:3856603-Prymnesium_polylepis.1